VDATRGQQRGGDPVNWKNGEDVIIAVASATRTSSSISTPYTQIVSQSEASFSKRQTIVDIEYSHEALGRGRIPRFGLSGNGVLYEGHHSATRCRTDQQHRVFIYGIALGLAPVWLLHAILLPINDGAFGKPRRAGKGECGFTCTRRRMR